MRKFLSFMMAVLFAGSLMATLPTSPIWEAKALADIADGSTVIIISNSTAATNIALPSTATTSNPAKVACTVTTSDGLTTITPPDGTTLQDLAWTVTKNGDYFKFFTEGSTTSRLYLTGLSSNTAIRVGTATSSYDNFVMGAVGKLLEVMNGDNRGSRFVGPNDNNGTDWRSYNSETGSNYKSAQLTFYVLKTTKTIYLNTGGTTLWGVDSPEFFAHSWGSADDDAHLTLEQGNIFKADIPIANTSVVFVRQKGGTSTIVWSGDDFYNKTADLTIPTDGKNCYTITGWGENEGTWGTYTPPTFTDVYFVNTEDWPEANIKLYGWLGSDNNGWPGVAMAKTGDKVNGFDVYTAKINDTYTTVIISNNGSDTERSGDQPFDAATPCFYNGVWYASLGAIPANCATINAAANGASMTLNAGAVVVYANGKYAFVKDASGSALIFDNSSNHGLTTGDTITADIAGSVSVYKNLPEFVAATFPITARKAGEAPEIPVATEEPQLTNLNQVVVFQGVTFASSEYSSKSIVGTWNSKSVNFYDNWNQAIVFDLDKTYDITAAYSVYNTTLQAYIISAEPQAKFYITGNQALVEDAGSTAAAWAADAIKSTDDTYTLSLKAGVDYLMKVTFDGTWEGGSKGFEAIANPPAGVTGVDDGLGGNTNISFRLAADGDVTVTVAIVSGDTIITMSGDFELPAKYYITGNAALVGDGKAWNAAAVRATADSYTFVDLPAGDYRMKVTLDGTWDDPDNNVKGIANLTTRAAGLQDINGNIGFTLADKGDVTVTFNATKFELEGDFVVTPIVKTFMATTSGWSSDDESSAVYDAVNEKIIVNLVKYKEAQWQAQVHYQGPIAKAGKYYDISLKFLANKNVNGVTLKYQDNAEMLYEGASINLVADETYVYTKNNLDGVDGGNGIFVFDFGFAAAGTVIEISDIQIVERDAFYTVAGVPSLCGSNWDETDTDNDMVLSEGLYTWTKNDVILRKGNVEFKVVKNHDWNNGANAWPAENYALAIAQDGKYDVVITFNESTQEIHATATFKEAVALDHTAVLKGLADNENPWIGEDMEQAQDKLTASITKYFIPSKPEGDTLEFKMVIDDAWRSNGYLYHRGFVGAAGIVGDVTPTDENNGNMKVVVDVEGDYVFTWTFANDSLGIEFPYKAPDVYTVAGDAVLFTSNWDPADDANDMPFDDVNGVFYWGADDVVLLTGNIEFKVVKNHDWNNGANAWPAENYVLNIPQDGKYDVLITFNAETKEIVATATFKEPVEVDPTAVLKGLADGENPWVGEDMILAQDKLSASITKHFVPSDADGDTLTFKMMINGGWRSNGYLYHRGFVGATDIVDNVDDNMLVVVDIEGDYTFTWTFADNALEITFPAKPEPVLANGYYLIGKTGWDEEALSADLKFAANPDADGEFMLTIALAVSDHIKVVFVEDDAIQTWYPDGLGNEYIVDADHAGAAKTIYFKPAYDENWAAFGGYIWIDANSPATGINNTDANAKVEKVLENGQVFIIKNGQIFNVTGQLVK